MTKKILSALAACMLMSSVFAFQSVTGGESLFELAGPTSMTFGSSVTGGGISFINSASIAANPALTAKQERVGLNLGYTGLLTAGEKKTFGSMFQTGILIPFRWAVVTGELYGAFPLSETLGFKNSMNLRGGLSKEITDNLSVGVGLNTGFAWGIVPDWALSADLGFVYNKPRLSFMKDFRYGVSLLNLGKNYSSKTEKAFIDCYPGFLTVKAGASALLFTNDYFKIGANFDLTTPCFMNLIMDCGVQFSFQDILTLNVSEKINLVETIHGNKSFIPSVGLFFTFKFNVKESEFLEKNDWSESEMTAGVGYKMLYSNVHAISTDLNLSLGLKDETPPVINIWFDDDDEVELIAEPYTGLEK